MSPTAPGRGPFLRIALCQIPVGDDPEENADRVVRTIRGLGRRKIDLALFPEGSLSRFLPPPDPRPWRARAAEVAARIRRARAACREARVGAAIGVLLPTRRGLLNSALLISARGRTLGRTDKAHLPGSEACLMVSARSRPPVLRLRGIPIGLQICFDCRFPEGFRSLALRGARLIAVLFNARGKTAWKRPVLASNLSSRAAENGVWVAGVNNARPRQLVASHAFRPDGTRLLSTRPDREEIRVFTADLSKVSGLFLRKRRGDLYD